MGATLNFLTQYEKDGNDSLEWIIIGDENWIHFYEPERKSASMVWKKEEGTLRKLKNEQSTRQVMLTALWDFCGLAYAEFGPDAHKDKQNISQYTYFNTFMQLRSVIWFKRQGYLS